MASDPFQTSRQHFEEQVKEVHSSITEQHAGLLLIPGLDASSRASAVCEGLDGERPPEMSVSSVQDRCRRQSWLRFRSCASSFMHESVEPNSLAPGEEHRQASPV